MLNYHVCWLYLARENNLATHTYGDVTTIKLIAVIMVGDY